MGVPLAIRGRIRRLAISVTVPTISGTPRVGSTLSLVSTGSYDIGVIRYTLQWQESVAPFSIWTDIAGATDDTFIPAAAQIGKQIRLLVTPWTLDGRSLAIPTAPTAAVANNPALPLEIIGEPDTQTTQGVSAAFPISIINGRPAQTNPKYTVTLDGPWPAGSSLSMNAAADQGSVIPGVSVAGTYPNLRVKVTDASGATAFLGPYTLGVGALADIPLLTPGGGWTGPTLTVTNTGSASEVGYGFAPRAFWAVPPFETYTEETVIELMCLFVGPLAQYLANRTPLFGVKEVKIGVDGAWHVVPGTFNAQGNRWSYRFRIDPGDWPDGTHANFASLSQRELRADCIGYHGNSRVLQGAPPGYNMGLRFSTNAGGSLSTPIKYVDGANGNDANDGNSRNTAYKTPKKAAESTAMGGIIRLMPFTGYVLDGPTTEKTDNGRYLTFEADVGVPINEVVVTNYGGRGPNAPKLKLRNLSITATKSIPMFGLTESNGVVTHQPWALCTENLAIDRGAEWIRVNDVGFYTLAAGCMVCVQGGTIRNWPNGLKDARLAKDVYVPLIANDLMTNAKCCLNISFDRMTGGDVESSPGVPINPGVTTHHADTLQLYASPKQPPTVAYPYGGIFYGVYGGFNAVANAQGPFFKDNTEIQDVYLVNWNIKLTTNPIRNSFYLHSLETMRASMFYNVRIENGQRIWSGPCEDVIAVGLQLVNQSNGANSVPSQILNYTP